MAVPATSQLCFCSLVLVDYVLILYDYQMAFSPLCSVVYALGLVRLISRYYDVPQCSTMHPNRCLLLRPCLPCSCLHHAILLVITLFSVHVAPLRAYRPLSSYRASFPTNSTSGISCHVRRFIRHAVDTSRVVLFT